MSGTAIEIQNLYITSGNRYLLQNINWEIQRGENWILFGENGCGKTTLLSTIAGYHAWSKGSLKVFEETYTKDNVFTLRRKIGWVSSSFFDKYYHSEKAIDIVLSGLFGSLSKQFDVGNADIVKAQQLMTQFHLANKMERPFDSMSKGERQNVLLARAMISDPELLILDEPGSGLDVFARESMLRMIDEIAHDEERTVIYVTHYPEEILPSFNKCVLMKNGAFVMNSSVEAAFSDTEMSAFVGMPIKIKKHENKYYFTEMIG